MSAQAADAFGVHHAEDCQHPERVARSVTGGWTCNGCGQESPTTTITTTKEKNK